MHKIISKHFNNAQYFGFTGTPIFEIIIKHKMEELQMICLKNVFILILIKDAIKDENVLGFSVDYVKTFTYKNNMNDEEVEAIDTDEVLLDDMRINLVVSDVLDHYTMKTRNKEYNALFTTFINTNVD
jgi:type I restriction enzyme R subunit